jgi:hypothetical protein
MMHGHEFGGDWFHLIPGIGHGLFGLLIWGLLIFVLAVFIRSFFTKKE